MKSILASNSKGSSIFLYLNNFFRIKVRQKLQCINVLCEDSCQDAFVVQQFEESVGEGGLESLGVDLADQTVERHRVLPEKRPVKHRLRIRQVRNFANLERKTD